MKKERLFYLDFVRAIAAVSIILTHFNAKYIFLEHPMPEKAVITTTVSNIYIGNWGVSLFFIISGAALMYVYEDKCDWKLFYKKRFFSIYPMFWMAYFFAFLYLFYINKAMPGDSGIAKIKIIFSLLGMDGLLAIKYPMFYILGEWFLGVIILVYLLFPIMRKLILRYPVMLITSVMVLYLWMLSCYCYDFDKSVIIFTRLPEICFGMFFVKIRKKVSLKVAVCSLCILILNGILKPSWSVNLQTTYVGILSFLLLVFLSYNLDHMIMQQICGIISKYSYSVFLVHHVIIDQMVAGFELEDVSRGDSYLLFITICVVIAFFSKALYILHDTVMKQINQIFKE